MNERKDHSKRAATVKKLVGATVPTASQVIPQEMVVEPIVPAIKGLPDVQELMHCIPQFASLRPKHLSVLMAIADDLMSDNTRSDSQMARDLGIERLLITRARQNVLFAQCLGVMVLGIARGRSDLYLVWTEQAARGGNSAMIRLLWELTGLYVPKSKHMNVNIDLTQEHVAKTWEDALDEMLISLGHAGWTADRIAARFNTLRSQGAF